MTIIIGGVSYLLIPVLYVLMTIAGPTNVAGTTGTTAAFLGNHAIEQPVRPARLKE